MGYKLICTNCRISFSVGKEIHSSISQICRQCHQPAYLLHHKFKPPKKRDKKGWKLVEFLIHHGFDFSSAYIPYIDSNNQFWGNLLIRYPENMEEANEFVKFIRPRKSSK